MKIGRVKIRRFKSIYDADIPLGPFTVLTGPNGSGKSNFTSALDFLGETYSYGLEYAVGRAGGLDSIAFRRTKRTTVPVAFALTVIVEQADLNASVALSIRRFALPPGVMIGIRHAFAVKASREIGNSTFSVVSETIEVYAIVQDGDEIPLFSINSTSSPDGGPRLVTGHLNNDLKAVPFRPLVVTRAGEVGDYSQLVEESVPATELMMNELYLIPIIRDVRRGLSRLGVYRLNPISCRTPGVFTPNATLQKDGENLPGVIERMRRHETARRRERGANGWDKLMTAMRELTPDLEDIKTTINSAGGLELQIVEEGIGRPWSAFEVSDGTIQYLALLAALYGQQNPALVIEEPENGLHSWMLRTLLETCRNETDRQVILTTHSPVVLKSVPPAEVLLVWKTLGQSRVVPLVKADPDAQLLYEEKGIDVFEQYDSGFLSQTIPGAGK